jgi:dTDP-4-dehydrorhamnose reductase
MRLLIAGGDGQLGREFAQLDQKEDVVIVRCSRSELDITQPKNIAEAIEKYQPQAIINAAAYTAVDRAESEPELAFAINADGAGHLARAAKKYDIPLLHVSTDYVFSGDKPVGEVWSETDTCAPLSVYGSSKLAGEQQVLAACERAFILRTSWVFGRYGNNFVKTMLRLARERDELRVVGDQHGCPTHAGDIAQTLVTVACAMIKQQGASGIYHYAGAPACTWYAFATEIIERAVALGVLQKKMPITAIATHEYPVAATRPMNSVMSGDKLQREFGIVSAAWQTGLDVVLRAQ